MGILDKTEDIFKPADPKVRDTERLEAGITKQWFIDFGSWVIDAVTKEEAHQKAKDRLRRESPPIDQIVSAD